MPKSFASIIAAFVVVSFATFAHAETLEPQRIEYDVDGSGDSQAAVCHLLVLIANYPHSPEAVKVTLTVATSMAAKQIYVGFIVDVADLQIKQGTPDGLQKTMLQSAAFYSNSFNSPGRLYGGPTGDGGVMMSTNDAATAASLISAFAAGDYLVEFTRQGAPVSRTYHIAAAPAAEVWGRFVDCYKSRIGPVAQ